MMTDLRRTTGESVRELAEWAASLSFDDIPDDVKRRAALVVADADAPWYRADYQ